MLNVKLKYKCFAAIFTYSFKKATLSNSLLTFRAKKLHNLKYLVMQALSDNSIK